MESYTFENKEPTDDEILDKAYNNAWLLFSNEKSFTQIALTPYMSESYMPFDPYELMDEQTFEYTKESMLIWFAKIEEYEKCAYLRDYAYNEYIELMSPYDTSKKK